MKKVAILIDGAFFAKKFKEKKSRFPRHNDIPPFANGCLEAGEELFRIYYYDCPPYEKEIITPISSTVINYKTLPKTQAVNIFHGKLAKLDYVALRRGNLSFDGWGITDNALNQLKTTPRPLVDNDFYPIFKQKEVDMKIGLDVSWLSTENIVDKIILIAGDSDFSPVLKFARREGIQTVLITLKHRLVRESLKDHCDEFRHREIV